MKLFEITAILALSTILCSCEANKEIVGQTEDIPSTNIDTNTSVVDSFKSGLCLNNICPKKKDTDNLIVEHGIFLLSYNVDTKFADWVAYREIAENMKGKYKDRIWKVDPKLPPELALTPEDYKGAYKACGTDRGHQVPLASFNNHYHVFKTNYLSNITPQKAKLNRGAWVMLEKEVRKLARKNVGDVYVVTGTYYMNQPICILPNAKLKHRVPSGYWKIIALKKGNILKYSSFIFNQETEGNDYCSHTTSIKEIEKLTNIDLNIPKVDEKENLMKDLNCQ